MMEPPDAGFVWKQTTEIAGYWSLMIEPKVEDAQVRLDEIELCLEPTVFGEWLLALYVDGQLVQPQKLKLRLPEFFAGGPLLRIEPEPAA